MRYYIKAFKNYCNINGRATRKELWLFLLFHNIIIFVLSFLDGFFGFYSTYTFGYGYMTIAYILISFCPTICVQFRRLHDVNKSECWFFLLLVPFISLYVFYLYLKRGDPACNSYGAPPVSQQDVEPATTSVEPLSEAPSNQYQTTASELTIDMPPRIKYCRKCGFKLIEGSKFCSRCGTAIVEE